MRQLFYTALIFLYLVISSCSISQNAKRITPFIRSLILNQNVYKTKDTLALKEVYDYQNKRIVRNNKIYILDPAYPKNTSSNFLRYSVVKMGDKQVIKIPGGVSFFSDKMKFK